MRLVRYRHALVSALGCVIAGLFGWSSCISELEPDEALLAIHARHVGMGIENR